MENKTNTSGEANNPSVNETILTECDQSNVEEKIGVFM